MAVKNISAENIDNLLNLQKGHYLIFGSGQSNGKFTLLMKLLSMIRSKWDINTTEINKKTFTLPDETIYKCNGAFKMLGGTITIHLILTPIKKEDIPEWVQKSYNCIYLPYMYVQNPVDSNQRKLDINFSDRQISVQELHQMTN